MKRVFRLFLAFSFVAVLLAVGGYFGLRWWGQAQSNSGAPIRLWFDDRANRPALITPAQTEPCADAPFLLPSSGLIGLLWGDSIGPYTIFRKHSGVDIFGDGAPGTVPVVAAYDGYLSRLPEWVATVIIQHEDPLNNGRTIWTYYTHMASRDGVVSYISDAFPRGTSAVWVEQGTLLGYQGEYAGSGAPIGLHLHFSIVLSEPDGSFLNEADIANTVDPSPYLGMTVDIGQFPERPITCATMH